MASLFNSKYTYIVIIQKCLRLLHFLESYICDIPNWFFYFFMYTSNKKIIKLSFVFAVVGYDVTYPRHKPSFRPLFAVPSCGRRLPWSSGYSGGRWMSGGWAAPSQCPFASSVAAFCDDINDKHYFNPLTMVSPISSWAGIYGNCVLYQIAHNRLRIITIMTKILPTISKTHVDSQISHQKLHTK